MAPATTKLGTLIALALALGSAAYLAFAPCAYRTSGARSAPVPSGAPGPEVVATDRCMTLVAHEGASVVGVLLVPALVAALAVANAWLGRRFLLWTLGGVLVVLCLLGAASIGLFFLPTALALLLSAMSWDSQAPGRPHPERARPGG